MKKIFFLAFITISLSASSFVHPLDFKGSEKEKENTIEYIKVNVKKTYAALGMDNPSTLRMMENKELDSFKILIKAKNRTLLDSVIKTYCSIGMCTYNTIEMMYKKQNEDSKKKLKW